MAEMSRTFGFDVNENEEREAHRQAEENKIQTRRSHTNEIEALNNTDTI